MTRYLLDTNIMSHMIRDPTGTVASRVFTIGEHTVCTSIIAAAELRFGAAKRSAPRLTGLVDDLLSGLLIEPWDSPADQEYARLRANLERAGTVIGNNDLLIAAHALALDATVVTDNVREFSRVDGLNVENWLR